jgi:hypothetical protein
MFARIKIQFFFLFFFALSCCRAENKLENQSQTRVAIDKIKNDFIQWEYLVLTPLQGGWTSSTSKSESKDVKDWEMVYRSSEYPDPDLIPSKLSQSSIEYEKGKVEEHRGLQYWLDGLGKDGWELASSVETGGLMLVFKRHLRNSQHGSSELNSKATNTDPFFYDFDNPLHIRASKANKFILNIESEIERFLAGLDSSDETYHIVIDRLLNLWLLDPNANANFVLRKISEENLIQIEKVISENQISHSIVGLINLDRIIIANRGISQNLFKDAVFRLRDQFEKIVNQFPKIEWEMRFEVNGDLFKKKFDVSGDPFNKKYDLDGINYVFWEGVFKEGKAKITSGTVVEIERDGKKTKPEISDFVKSIFVLPE